LAQMKDATPDLIVTDLQMPVMDGLQLVTSVRTHHAKVPVILITAHGSEALALEALEQGAASYVPKARIAEKLVSTIEEVLGMARANRSHEQLISSLSRAEFTFSLENEPALVDALVDFVQQMVAGMGLCDFTGRLQIGVAMKEALLNALFHGNLEISLEEMQEVEDMLIKEKDVSLVEKRASQPPYGDRRLFVDVKITPEEARFLIRDEGPGFDTALVPDPGKPEALEPERGRGLSLMRSFMDEVTFNKVGNEVTMIKRREHTNDDDSCG